MDTLARPFSQTLPPLHFSEVVVAAVRGGQGKKGGRWLLFKKREKKKTMCQDLGKKGRIGFGKEFNGSEMQCNPNMLRQAQLG